MSVTHNFGKSTGILSTNELNSIWKQFVGKGNELSIEKLIEVLVKLEFAHKLPTAMMNDSLTEAATTEQCVLVPHLLPIHRPYISCVWPRVIPCGLFEWGRTFVFPFLPIGFFGKLIARLLHFPVLTKAFWWQSGLVLKVNNTIVENTSSLLLSKEEKNQSTEQEKTEIILVELIDCDGTKKSLVIRMRTIKPVGVESVKVFSQVIDTVENLLEGFYPKLATKTTRLVPCTHCLSQQQSIPGVFQVYHFSQDKCVSLLLSGNTYCLCNDIPSRPVPFHEMIPDLSLSNICSIDMKEITKLKDLGKGGFGVV